MKLIIGTLINLPDFPLTLVGLMVPKAIRVQPIILHDEKRQPVADRVLVQRDIDLAKEVFEKELNVRLIVPLGGVSVHPDAAPSDVLEVDCASRNSHFLTSAGAWFRANQVPLGSFLFTGYGAPITGFLIRDVLPSTEYAGCNGWLWNDYFVAEPSSASSVEGIQLRLAHEVGHCCNLLDRGDDTLMSGSPTGRTRKLTNWQKAVFRSSRYVTYRSPF